MALPDRIGERERPWRDKETLEYYWYHTDMTIEEISEEFGCGDVTIHRWVERFGLDRREKHGGPWQDKETLTDLYWNHGMSQQEIAEHLGCNQATISKWFGEHNIPARYTQKEYGNLFTDRQGYEKFCVDGEYVILHRLLAVAEYGFDAVGGMDVHHESRVPWDNRPGNIAVLSPSEHSKLHVEDRAAARRNK